MSQPRYIFRPKTIPISRHKSRARMLDRRDQVANESQAVDRPQDNFFKLVFQRDTYLWVIFHKSIKKIEVEKMVSLFDKMNNSYSTLQLDHDNLPICSQMHEVMRWLSQYQCKVALDESVIEYYDQILAHPNCILAKVVSQANIEVVRKIRKSKHSYKVRSVDDTYDNIISSVKEDMEKVKILKEAEKLQKVRLPNFMKLKLKDKADLITYRSNIYCLANLHKNKIDMETSKKRFIEQCEKIYSSEKDKQFMKYYLTYPFNYKEILRFYTEDSFFYKCINNTLRMARNTEEFYIIGQPFNQMFHAIKNVYKEQYPYTQTRKNLKVYRGADLSQTQCKYLQSCIGNYIQIHGFVSTTIELSVAQKFAKDRKHNKILQIIFEDIVDSNSPAIENDYGFVNLIDISRFEENQILFNTLNIFKVMGKEVRQDYEYFTLKYGTIFNVLNKKNPELLKRDDRLAYYTYKELMGERDHLQDLGQVFLKSNQTQKSVDYYETKIIQAKSQNRLSEVVDLIIKKSQALILNGEPAKALEHMMILLTQRKNIKQTTNGARFLESILSDKEEIIKEIDITKKYSQAGHSLDKFDQAETQLTDTNQALQDALKQINGWDFDIAFGQFEVLMQLAHLKQSLQNYKEMFAVLREAQFVINQILQKVKENDVSFHNHKKAYLQKTLVYQLMAKNSQFLQGDQQISIEQLQKKYSQTERELSSLVEEKSYDKSLIQIRKIQIQRRRQDFNNNKERFINKLQQSLVSIKQTSTQDDQIPKTYHMLAEIQKTSNTVSSTNTAIEYYQKQFVTQSQYYGENDPRPMKTVIDIAQCHRNLKDSQQSIDILREQVKIVPFKNKPNHTIVTKTLYTMGLAYLDIGQFSYALKCFEKGLNMLHQVLSKKQIEKYQHRYKIELQLGRTFTFLTRYNQAEQKLFSYHNFIVKLYQNHHSDIANSLNHFAILYLKMKQLERARQKFEQSADMFRMTSGEKALVVAKIKCNLGMVYAILKNEELALKNIDEAKFLFNEIYSIKGNHQNQDELIHAQTHMISFYYAQIYKMFKNIKEALHYYVESKENFQKHKLRKKKEKDLKGVSFISHFNSRNPITKIFDQGKKDNHELICKVKIIECRAKLKDFSFWSDLQQVIKQLQRQTLQYNEMENSKIQEKNDKILDKGCVSQLNNLLAYCNELYKHYEANKQKYNKKSKKNKKAKAQEKLEEEKIDNNEDIKQQIQGQPQKNAEEQPIKEQLDALVHHGQDLAQSQLPLPENVTGQNLMISNIKSI